MDGIRLIIEYDFTNIFVTAKCQLDLGIVRPGYGFEKIKMDDFELMALFLALINSALQSGNNTIDLWFPCISGYQYPHGSTFA
jgi:hypothetical protein